MCRVGGHAAHDGGGGAEEGSEFGGQHDLLINILGWPSYLIQRSWLGESGVGRTKHHIGGERGSR